MEIKKELERLRALVLADIKQAHSLSVLDHIKSQYLGRKSVLVEISKGIKDLPDRDRPAIGKIVNETREAFIFSIESKRKDLEKQATKLEDAVDVTLPGNPLNIGKLHPITTIMNDIITIFEKLGFSISEGPDIESDYYNFSALNFPTSHPARDAQDTFFLDQNDAHEHRPFLLRTHTSPVQIRYMKQQKPPFQIVVPGTVYRCDSDVSHTPMFHQVEGLAVGHHVTFAHLKWILTEFIHTMFGKDVSLRFRPSFFPFTEPSAEIDISCVMCDGTGCRVCKESGWIEILGAGMVHPNVFKSVGYPSANIQGFAFGMGVERIAMLRYQINDIRLFFENDLRFLKQF